MTNSKSRVTLARSFYILLSIGFSIAFCTSAAKQKPGTPYKRCPVNTINYEQGLMSNSIKSIITDRQGFTWVSTSTGLQRYNGYSLQAITPKANGDTIKIDYPVYFAEGKKGTILIGYKKGILEYNAAGNFFRKIVSLAGSAGRNGALMPIEETGEGIWCLSENNGIIIYNRNGKLLRQLTITQTGNVTDLIRTEGYDITRKLVVFNSNFIFIRISPNRILQINTQTHNLRNLDIPGFPIIGLECDNDKIFISTFDGLSSANSGEGKVLKKFLYKQITNDPVTRSSLELSSGGKLLLVSVEKRLFEFDTSCTLKREIISLNRVPLMKTGYIQLVYEDRLKRIWLITDQDIRRIQNAETPFAHFIYADQGENFIRCIYYDKEKNWILAGSFSGAIQLFDSAGNTLMKEPLADKQIKNILSIEKLSEDHYLVVTLANGLWMFQLSKMRLKPFDLRTAAFFQSSVKVNSYSNNLQRVDGNTIFIGTKSNVFRCNFKKSRLVSAYPLVKDSNLTRNFVSCFIYSSAKTLWVATQSGSILKIDANNNLHIMQLPEDAVVRCMAEDGVHNIWIGTVGGLFIYSDSGKLIKHINRTSGLLSDFIYALLPADNNNGFFASTGFGLSFISKDGTVKNYTRELGLQENEFNTQSAATSPGGKLFFGGINGITAFYPSSLSVAKDSSPIYITRLVVNDSCYISFGGTLQGDSIRLAYNQNHLQFDIAATGLLNPNQYLYRYRLNGFEKSWQTTNQPTGIRYTLQPGTYLLEIMCSPILFSETGLHKKITIIIDPPWWKTWWFIFASVLAAVLAIFSSSYYVLKEQYQLKLRKLEMRNQLIVERERISRELHDNIGSQLSYISSNIDWLVETPESFSKEEEAKRLSIVNDTAKNLVTDLRETIWAMKKESVMLDELSDKLKSFLQSQCVLQPLMEMVIEERIEKNYSFSPTEALNVFRICQEAIVNAFRHSKAEKLCFRIESGADEDFSFTIADNGKGFIPEKRRDGHYGLENMKHRALESGAQLLIKSETGKGTTVTISKAASIKK